jgi:hypothetical protein
LSNDFSSSGPLVHTPKALERALIVRLYVPPWRTKPLYEANLFFIPPPLGFSPYPLKIRGRIDAENFRLSLASIQENVRYARVKIDGIAKVQ